MRDMLGLAPTGSGKSAAFLLPLIAQMLKMPKIDYENGPYALILAPSRELALQIHLEFERLADCTHLAAVPLVGGKSSDTQSSLIYKGAQVVIGTPGRIIECLERRYLVLNQCYFVIMDEADKMIDLDLEE